MDEKERKHPLAECEKCPLYEQPYVPTKFRPDAGIIIVGEGPGAQEVQQNEPFVGPSGQLLDRAVAAVGGEPRAYTKTNVVSCRPPGNREPSALERACCQPRLQAELAEDPEAVVLALGKTARESLVGAYKEHSTGVPYDVEWGPADGHTVIASWHPAYILRRPSAFDEFKNNLSTVYELVEGVSKPFDPNPPFMVIEDVKTLRTVLDEFIRAGVCVFDFETDQVNFQKDAILCLALTYTDEGGYIIPGWTRPKHDWQPRDMLYGDDEARRVLKEFFLRDDITFVGHNAKFDLHFLWEQVFGGEWVGRLTFDTMLAHYATKEVYPHDLKTLVTWEFGWPDYESDLIQRYLKNRNDYYSKVPPRQLYQYAVLDVIGTYKLYRLYGKRMEKEGVSTLFENILMPASHALTRMEHRGMPVDMDWLREADEYMGELMEQAVFTMKELLYEQVDDDVVALHDTYEFSRDEFNPNYWKDVATAVYEVFDLPPNPRSRTNMKRRQQGKDGYSTAQDALEHLASINPKSRQRVRDGHPFVDVLFHYRRVAKLRSSYVQNLLEAAERSTDGRVHATARIPGTEVGRLAFRDPAVQTIPRAGEHWGQVVRSAVRAEDGYLLGIIDYAQAEWRIAVAESGDEYLMQQLWEGKDIHSIVAEIMYGPDFTKEQRVQAKMFNFAYLYGGSEHSFAEDAGMPLSTARSLVGKFNEDAWQLVEWKREQFRKAKKQGYVTTRTGRKRRFPLITRENLDEIRKASVHAPVAGGASDMALLSTNGAEENNLRTILTVHDSVLIEELEEEIEEKVQWLTDHMVEVASEWYPEVPWKVDPEIRKTWVARPKSLRLRDALTS